MSRRMQIVWLLAAIVLLASTTASVTAVMRVDCGAPVQSIVLMDDKTFETTRTAFTRVPNAIMEVIVPAEATRCIKVRFIATVVCRGGSGSERCFIRAVADGLEMEPKGGGGDRIFSGRQFEGTGGAYQWTGRFGAGTHRLQIQVRSDGQFTTVGVDDWTMDVEILE